jgi:hypothetical protein
MQEKKPRCDDGTRLLTKPPPSLTAKRKSRRPVLNLLVLLILMAACGAGIPLSLASTHVAQPLDTPGASLTNFLLLASASNGLLYALIHIVGAMRRYKRTRNGPPQLFRNYLHTAAIIVARLGLFAWLITLITTLIVVVRASPLGGVAGTMCGLTLLDSFVAL